MAQIILENESNTFYSGTDVKGRVEYSFDEPIKLTGISVHFKGEARTFWSESKKEKDASGVERNVSKEHTGLEEYFRINYYVLGNKDGQEMDIQKGSHNFRCSLPPTVPSSFEGEFGYIRYTMEAVIETSANIEKKIQLTFTVINPLDLNTNPSYKTPIHIQMEKVFYCWCCKSAPISVDVRTPISGYCSGQKIPIDIEVENKSNIQVHLVNVHLRKIVAFRATEPSHSKKVVKHIVMTLKEGPIPAGESKTYKLEMLIPPTPPSNLINCSIIDLDYDLKVHVQVPGMHFDMKDKKYITIGTIPLVFTENTDGQPSAPSGDNVTVPPPQGANRLYPTLSDPTFEEMERDPESPAVFAPRYPVYSMPVPKP